MRESEGAIHLSATDLAHHLACRHKTSLDLAYARGELDCERWFDPDLEALWERGLEHEEAYVGHLRDEGLDVLDLRACDEQTDLVSRTTAAMKEGRGAIVQAGLRAGRWSGRADVLRRVERASALGSWSYEVVDTKLATETKASAVLQLCVYSDLLTRIQGEEPRSAWIVTPASGSAGEEYRLSRLRAYYRHVRRRLETAIDEVDRDGGEAPYPEPCEHCEICRWRWHCDRRRRDDRHLSLVAGLRRSHRTELEERSVTTIDALAALPVPLEWMPSRGSRASFAEAREQARLQVASEESSVPRVELRELDDEHGLRLLPAPSAGDVFFDLEGSRFARSGGHEFLFGVVETGAIGGEALAGSYVSGWALDETGEKAAFAALVDRLIARWEADDGFHAYHFGSYDVAALKRLMGRHTTREDEMDRLLRGERFVDLSTVFRRAVRAGVESYALKDLEAIFGFRRQVGLERAARALRQVQRFLERRGQVRPADEDLATVERYNEDDCRSLVALRDWLESLRAAEASALARPALLSGEPNETIEADGRRVAELDCGARRGAGEHADEGDAGSEGARALLADLLDYHRRELKAGWWQYYQLRDATLEELRESRYGVADLEFAGSVEGGTARCPAHRYRYPDQPARLKPGDPLEAGEVTVGTVLAWDPVARTVDVKKRTAAVDLHPTAGFAYRVIGAGAKAEALMRLAEKVCDSGTILQGSQGNLLLRSLPTPGGPCVGEGESLLEAARRWGVELGDRVLALQGPPGSGKTYTGARMVVDLAAAGARVAVMANSHKVIAHFLREVGKAAADEGVAVGCARKPKSGEAEGEGDVPFLGSAQEVLEALEGGERQVVGGTAWLWSHPLLEKRTDVLVVDEAGQASLADVLAAAQAARGLVLLGDPQQLEQPLRGSHPEGSEASALEHWLRGSRTLAEDEGIFLERTYRLHPRLAAFTSEVFYEGRLGAVAGLEHQAILGPVLSDGGGAASGLFFAPVEHSANRSESPEEVAAVSSLVARLTDGRSRWRDRRGEERELTIDDLLVIAPYNDQVAALRAALPGLQVGTVDRFQGREAPVVIYSMATSTPEEAPRGMEFLYSPSRLNVATSRARAASILVASPAIFQPDCRTPRQMELADAFCRYLELATTLEGVGG